MLTLNFFDSESQPRTVKLAPKQAAAERSLVIRLMQTLQKLSAASSFMVDTTHTSASSETFNNALLSLYLDAASMRQLEQDPSLFPKLIAKFLPKTASTAVAASALQTSITLNKTGGV